MKKKRRFFLICALLCLNLVFTACSSGNSSTGNSSTGNPAADSASPSGNSKPYDGKTVKLLLPPWFDFAPDFFKPFTDQTGAKVELQTMDWQQIHDNIVTASLANSAVADVVEVDWSWVGQFGAAKWLEPLDAVFSAEDQKDIAPANIFKYNNELIGVPFSNDFRVYITNKDLVGNLPLQTFDDLMASAKKLKDGGKVKYPIVAALGANEDFATTWYGMVTALGGQVLDKQMNLTVTDKSSPAYKALTYLFRMYNDQLIDPKSLGLKGDEISNSFKSGQGAIQITFGGPGTISQAANPDTSSISGKVQPIIVPGVNGKHTSFGLPEGLGILKNSQNKEAAKAFVKWMLVKEQGKKAFSDKGVFPVRSSVVKELSDAGSIKFGDVYVEQLKDVVSLFPQGAPTWYSQFSISVASTLNFALKNHNTVDEAVQFLSKDFDKINKK